MDQDKFLKDWLEGKIDPDKLDKSGQEEDSSKLVEGLDGIVKKSGQLDVPSNKSKAQAWDELMGKIDEKDDSEPDEKIVNESTTKSFSISRYIPIGIAASLLIVAVTYFLIPGELAVLSGRGEQISHLLPDGSKVLLNADSEITYSKSDYKKRRSVNLKGEAFFEVEPGESFVVVGEYGSIEVLGTSFNAYFRGEDISVSCFTGKVMVKKGGVEKKLLSGQITKSDNTANLTAPATFDNSKIAAWRSGEFYYDQVPFSEVLEELERQFNIEIQYSATEDRIYNGYFNNQDLDEALQLVFRPMSLDYSQEGSKVVVR